MLQSLSIRNIVLIETLDIQFRSGLCVLTGETGAGKSILLDALGFVLGERSSPQLIRYGSQQAIVNAEFDIDQYPLIKEWLHEQGFDSDSALFLRRMLNQEGKNRAFINDTSVSIGLLKQLGEMLVEVHGQHSQQGLLEASAHRALLDAYGQLEPLVKEVRDGYVSWKETEKKRDEAQKSYEQQEQEIDYLQHLSQELAQLSPEKGEEEILLEKRRFFQHYEKRTALLQELSNLLQADRGVYPLLASADRMLARNVSLFEEKELEGLMAALERAGQEISEAITLIETLEKDAEYQEFTIDTIEERLFSLRDMARKCHCHVDQLPETYEKVQTQLQQTLHSKEELITLQQQSATLRENYIERATKLHERRMQVAQDLQQVVMKELPSLKMSTTEFIVSCERLPDMEGSEYGFSKVQFVGKTHASAAIQPLHKIASGGELSRLMLAIKVALASINQTPTLIFDEVDTGIGGAVAEAVGRRLAELSQHAQLLVVTHQPQVAAHGDYHLKVAKYVKDQGTYTSVSILNEVERQEEIARMLSGEEITYEARAAAQRLMEMSV